MKEYATHRCDVVRKMNNSNNTDKIRVSKIHEGCKIYCDNKEYAIKLNNKLNEANIETNIMCNEAEMWSIYIVKFDNVDFSILKNNDISNDIDTIEVE